MKLKFNPEFVLGKMIGSGDCGWIYETTITDPQAKTDSRVNNKSFVLKTVVNHVYNPEEVEIQSRYNTTFSPNHTHFKVRENKSSWLTARVKGKHFSKFNTQNLPLLETLRLSFEFASRMNIHHHNTPATGPAVVHGDIKNENVLFSETIDLIDYGFSFDLNDDNPNALIRHPTLKFDVNPWYFPVETRRRKFGIKTDIYMAAGMLSDVIRLNMLPEEIKPHVIRFFQRCDLPYNQRPDSDAFLKFFTSLYLYCKASEYSNSEDDMKEELKKYSTILQLLSLDLFDETTVKQEASPDLINSAIILFQYKLGKELQHLKDTVPLQQAVISLAQHTKDHFPKYFKLLKAHKKLHKEVADGRFENITKYYVMDRIKAYINQRETLQDQQTGCFYAVISFFQSFAHKDAATKLNAARKMLHMIEKNTNPTFFQEDIEALKEGSLRKIYEEVNTLLPQYQRNFSASNPQLI